LWLDDEGRLTEWYWLEALNKYMGLHPETSWIDHLLYYQGSTIQIPELFSATALTELEKERNRKARGDPRRDFLEEVWIPFVKHNRWELAWWRKMIL
jgi:hypothetical protein